MNWELFFISFFEKLWSFLAEGGLVDKKAACTYLAGIEYHIEGIDIKDDKDRYFLEDFIHYADVFLEDIKMEDFPMERKEILDYLDAIHCQAKNLIENVEQRAL